MCFEYARYNGVLLRDPLVLVSDARSSANVGLIALDNLVIAADKFVAFSRKDALKAQILAGAATGSARTGARAVLPPS